MLFLLKRLDFMGETQSGSPVIVFCQQCRIRSIICRRGDRKSSETLATLTGLAGLSYDSAVQSEPIDTGRLVKFASLCYTCRLDISSSFGIIPRLFLIRNIGILGVCSGPGKQTAFMKVKPHYRTLGSG